MSKVIEVSKKDFQKEVFESEIPVLVDFWTDSCGPCEAMVPLLNEFSELLEGKLKITKFHLPLEEIVANSNEIAKKFDVMGFPTFILFKNGEIKETKEGMMFEEEFQQFINRVL